MKKIKTLTIGIPAYNEEANIPILLNSLMEQQMKNYKLEKIIVVCDGCEDNTAKKARLIGKNNGKIDVIECNVRNGKAYRLNHLFRKCKSDIFVIVDADIVFSHERVLEEIVNCFENDKVGLVGGYDKPFTPKTILEKVLEVSTELWFEIRKDVKEGESIHNHHGCISALRRSLYKKIYIPRQIIGDDDYIYLKNASLGYKFKFANNAVVYYRNPTNLLDFFDQSSRFLNIKNEMADLFGEYVYQEYYIPGNHKILALTKVLLREPLFLIPALLLQFFLRFYAPLVNKNKPYGIWNQIKSSKMALIKYE